TLAFGGISVILLIGCGGRPLAFALLGTAIYGVGAFLVTMLYSVPLNEALASAIPTPETAARIWNEYLEPWVFWNTLRM
ncbi:anthrone oxygenase family protein, partial [Citrobacter koseri]|uniref:anthrone oxygenase family protein n=1 Tax=Citrobacter koseri TaxID=545 RepID=UPI0013D89AF9